ncbi:hypothetical protein ILUMI_11173, partial [Ignelater luminosus]
MEIGITTLFCRFIKKFKQTFSLILLFEYITVGPLICVELFTVTESRLYFNQAQHGCAFVFFTLQLALYCIPANYIESKALAISDAVYFSNWYVHYFRSLKTLLVLMIENSQAGITIKAGGLITINAQTLVN